MAELLSSFPQRPIQLHQGQAVEGKVVSLADKEIVLELGAKSEGVLPTRGIPESIRKELKVGDTLKPFVSRVENEFGQAALSWQKELPVSRSERGRGFRRADIDWNRFIAVKNQNSTIKGVILEVNKGGLVVEVEGVRGFLPSSQIGFETLKAALDNNDVTGQEVSVSVIEVDAANLRLIFSQKNLVDDSKQALKELKNGQKVKGKVIAVLDFGLFISLGSHAFGVVLSAESTWDKQDDLSKIFQTNQEVEAFINGVDLELGRVNLSIRQLQEDPFKKLAEKFNPDDVITGTVVAVTPAGVTIALSDGIEGFLPASKTEGNLEVGQKQNFLVDIVDKNRRRVNLAPLVTTTKDLIYK